MTAPKGNEQKSRLGPADDYTKLLSKPVSDPEMTPELQAKIDHLLKYLDQTGISYDKFSPKFHSIKEPKKAYPNYDQYMYVPGPHNISKWLATVKSIYQTEQAGANRVASIRQATANWKPMETFDFLNWLRYYEGGNQLKYKMAKTAQLWYEGTAPGYFLQVKPDPKAPEPKNVEQDIDFARQQAADDSDKRDRIEKQRHKIVGRLDSAEKLLRSRDGHLFAGKELEALMEAIYQLKKKIQLVNKLSEATKLYDDMIVRQSNILHRDGFVKASQWLCSQSQANNPPPADREIGRSGQVNVLPPPVAPESPSAPLHPGAPGGLPSMGPGMSQNAPASTGVPNAGPNENSPNLAGAGNAPTGTAGNSVPTPMPQDVPPGISEFLDKMNDGKETEQDHSLVVDELDTDDLYVADTGEQLMVSEAQAMDSITTDPTPTRGKPIKAPVAPAKEPAKLKPATEEPLEVSEDDIAAPPKNETKPSLDASEFDRKVDAVFANVTIADVVAKLEDVAKIYKTREVPRQLSVIDMMLDSLGLASYFPSLSEAINKSLESNNYISTRLDEVLSRLRGSVPGQNIDLKGEGKGNPETEIIRKNLSDVDAKEKARKQQRKEQSDAELTEPVGAKETPEVEIAEDLAPKTPPAPRSPPPRNVPIPRSPPTV